MRIGFDIDGVLANFVSAYQATFVRLTGRDDFAPGDVDNPPTWHWPELRGYTFEETRAVWASIQVDTTFWMRLQPTAWWAALVLVLPILEEKHDVYYLTDRPGVAAKRQTEAWLTQWLPYSLMEKTPTVLLTGKKGWAAAALKLDCYIDDKRENIVDVATQSPMTTPYLLDRRYNQGSVPRAVRRVDSLAAMFVAESDSL